MMRSEKDLPDIQTAKLVLITILMLVAAFGQHAYAGTITVSSTADSGPRSLRQALTSAADGDTISITAKGTILLSAGELIVDKSVNIYGPGASRLNISGAGGSRVFHITPNTIVTISGLTIKDGYASGAFQGNAGGGIYSDHARLTVTSCVLSGNSARYGGGVFYNSTDPEATPLTINNSTISNNSAIYGGGIFNDGGGFFPDSEGLGTNLTLNESLVANNSGGGIYNNGYLYGATLTLTNSTVSGNTSRGAGGIHNDGELGSATLVLINSHVIGNSGAPGGIHSSGNSGSATLGLTNSSVSGNIGGGIFSLVTNATLNNSGVNNNSAFIGGGIFSINGSMTLNDSAVNENTAGSGGGLFNDNGAITLNRSTVSGNTVLYDGGGIENVGTAALTLNKSTVDKNSAAGGGGGIGNYCDRSGSFAAVTLTSSTVSNNSGSLGGGIFNYGQLGGSVSFTLINSTVSSNSGLGIYTSGVGDGGSGFLILKHSTISDNLLAPGHGAGGIQNISLFGGIATVEIANTIINGDANGTIGSTGTVISHGYNLTSDDAGGLLNGSGDIINTNPMLGPLKNNGGPTKTHALLLGSPAIDAGDPNFDANAFSPPLVFDQRAVPGFLRVVNGRVDIGAFEYKHP
jgi:hypothetical protein